MLYRLTTFISRILFSILLRLEVKRHNDLLENKGVILAANHFSVLDALILAVSYPKEIFTMSKVELFKNPISKLVMTKLNTIPVNRKGFTRESIRKMLKLLKQNKTVAIFPEGTVSPDGKLGDFKLGLAKIALEAKVPIIPVAIKGSNRVLPPGQKIPRLNKVEVEFGDFIYLDDFYYGDSNCKDSMNKQTLKMITQLIKLRIGKLLNTQKREERIRNKIDKCQNINQ